MISNLRMDALRYDGLRVTRRGLFYLFVIRRGFRAVALYRLAHWLRTTWLGPGAKLLDRVQTMTAGCEISSLAEIGPGLLLPHPTGIVIGGEAMLGSNCTVQQGVTIGGNYGQNSEGRKMPLIGDGVAISAGAVVAGPIKIGSSVRIGANAVVTTDVEPHKVVSVARVEVHDRNRN